MQAKNGQVLLQVLLPPKLCARLHLDATKHRERLGRRLAAILAAHYARPPIPALTAHQRRRLDAATLNHESLEDVAKGLRITAHQAYAYVLAATHDELRDVNLPAQPHLSPSDGQRRSAR